MRLLLDSHVLIWAVGDDPALDSSVRLLITNSENDVFVSAASIWELAIKRAAGRLRLPETFLETVKATRFEMLAVRAEHAWTVGSLPPHHRDPFDRLLVAQAQLEQLTIVTRDPLISRYDVSLLPA